MTFAFHRLIVFSLVATISSSALLTARDGVHLRYFPERFDHPLETYEKSHFSRHLKAMREPVLRSEGKNPDYFAFRVLMLPSLREPVSMRYEFDGEKLICRVVILNGKGGYEPGAILHENTNVLKPDNVGDLRANITKMGFWKLPVNHTHDSIDGITVVFELVTEGRRHVRVDVGADLIENPFNGVFIGVPCPVLYR